MDINLGIQPVARDLVFGEQHALPVRWSGTRRVLVNVANTLHQRDQRDRDAVAAHVLLGVRDGNGRRPQTVRARGRPPRPGHGQAHVRFVPVAQRARRGRRRRRRRPLVFGNKAFASTRSSRRSPRAPTTSRCAWRARTRSRSRFRASRCRPADLHGLRQGPARRHRLAGARRRRDRELRTRPARGRCSRDRAPIDLQAN